MNKMFVFDVNNAGFCGFCIDKLHGNVAKLVQKCDKVVHYVAIFVRFEPRN